MASNLSDVFDIVMYSYNTSNIHEKYAFKYIGMVAGKDYPFYAVQFHPEMVVFEWGVLANHATEAVWINIHFAEFFVD